VRTEVNRLFRRAILLSIIAFAVISAGCTPVRTSGTESHREGSDREGKICAECVKTALVLGGAELAVGVGRAEGRLRYDSAFLGPLEDLLVALRWAGVEFTRAGDTITLGIGAEAGRGLRRIARQANAELLREPESRPLFKALAAVDAKRAGRRLLRLRILAACGSLELASQEKAPAPTPMPARRITIAAALPWSAKYLSSRGVEVVSSPSKTVISAGEASKDVEALLGNLEALRRRMRLIQANIAGAETTDAGGGKPGKPQPYRRKVLEIGPGGVLSVKDDLSKFRRIYKPEHKHKDAEGYVLFPNVYPEVEREELKRAVREYGLIARAVSVLRPDLIVPDAAPNGE